MRRAGCVAEPLLLVCGFTALASTVVGFLVRQPWAFGLALASAMVAVIFLRRLHHDKKAVTIEGQQALRLALACFVMLPKVKNAALKNTLRDETKLRVLITGALKTLYRDFDDEQLVKDQIEAAKQHSSSLDIRNTKAVKKLFARHPLPAASVGAAQPSKVVRPRSPNEKDDSIKWSVELAVGCGNAFAKQTQKSEDYLPLGQAAHCKVVYDTLIVFGFDPRAHKSRYNVPESIHFLFDPVDKSLTCDAKPVKSKRELVEILETRSSRQRIERGFFAPDSQLTSGHLPFNHRVVPPDGPGAVTPPRSTCTMTPYKRSTLIVGGETGSGKTTWSVYSLPQLVEAVHGVLYYSLTNDADDTMFTDQDGKIFDTSEDLFEELASLRNKFVAIDATLTEVFASLRKAFLHELPTVTKRDDAARHLFFSIVTARLRDFARKTTQAPKCLVKLVDDELWCKSTNVYRKRQHHLQAEPVDLAVVIDEVGRCPGFVRSIVGQCREIYATFQDVFNIRLVIVLCGTSTDLFMRKTRTFHSETDPSRAEKLTVKEGRGMGVAFANAIVNEQKRKKTVPADFPQVQDLPIGRLSEHLWTNARLTAEFLAAALAYANIKPSYELLCQMSLQHAYAKFQDRSGLSAYTRNMRRTLINVAYWALVQSRISPDSNALPEAEIPACLEDGLFLVYDPRRMGNSDGPDDEVSLLLLPATKLNTAEKHVLMTLRDVCMSMGLLSINEGKGGVKYSASPALEEAIACGFQVAVVQKRDGPTFEELVSLVAKRTAEVGGFRAITQQLGVGFPGPSQGDGLVYLNNVTELEAAVKVLEPIAHVETEHITDPQHITYVGAAVVVINGPSAQFADIIKICRVHDVDIVGAVTSVTFYDAKLDTQDLDHRAVTSGGCTLSGCQRLPRRVWSGPGASIPKGKDAIGAEAGEGSAAVADAGRCSLPSRGTDKPPPGSDGAPSRNARETGGTTNRPPRTDGTAAKLVGTATALPAVEGPRVFTMSEACFVARSRMVVMTWQEVAVSPVGKDRLASRIVQLDTTGTVSAEASQVKLRLVLQDDRQESLSVFAEVGPLTVRHQSRDHLGLYDKCVQTEMPSPPLILRPMVARKTCCLCRRIEDGSNDLLFRVVRGTKTFICDQCIEAVSK
jgi:hypothetical protein